MSGSRRAAAAGVLLFAVAAAAVSCAARTATRTERVGAVRIVVMASQESDVGIQKPVTRALADYPVRLRDARGRTRRAATDAAGTTLFRDVPAGRALAQCLIPNADPASAASWMGDSLTVVPGETTTDTLRPAYLNAKRLYR